jgi:hypothetical protein
MMDPLIATAALVAAAVGIALAPVPEVALVLLGTGVGAVIGAAVGQRVRRRHPELDAGPYIVRSTLFGGGLCAAFVLCDAVIRGVA